MNLAQFGVEQYKKWAVSRLHMLRKAEARGDRNKVALQQEIELMEHNLREAMMDSISTLVFKVEIWLPSAGELPTAELIFKDPPKRLSVLSALDHEIRNAHEKLVNDSVKHDSAIKHQNLCNCRDVVQLTNERFEGGDATVAGTVVGRVRVTSLRLYL